MDHEISQERLGWIGYLLVRDLMRKICQQENVYIIIGHVSKDHVQLFESIPPQATIGLFVQKLQGKTPFKLFNEFSHFRKTYWSGHFGAPGYFCCSSENVSDEVITQYIESQSLSSNDNF